MAWYIHALLACKSHVYTFPPLSNLDIPRQGIYPYKAINLISVINFNESDTRKEMISTSLSIFTL